MCKNIITDYKEITHLTNCPTTLSSCVWSPETAGIREARSTGTEYETKSCFTNKQSDNVVTSQEHVNAGFFCFWYTAGWQDNKLMFVSWDLNSRFNQVKTKCHTVKMDYAHDHRRSAYTKLPLWQKKRVRLWLNLYSLSWEQLEIKTPEVTDTGEQLWHKLEGSSSTVNLQSCEIFKVLNHLGKCQRFRSYNIIIITCREYRGRHFKEKTKVESAHTHTAPVKVYFFHVWCFRHKPLGWTNALL